MLSTIKFFDNMEAVKDDTADKAEEFWPTLVEFLFATKSWWNAVCAEFDLTPAQGQALKVLDPARPLPMSTLAEALLCDASNVTGIVDKLESRGLIARQGTEHDRRVKQLAVTDRGRKIREKLVAAIMTPPAAVLALPSDVKTRVAQLLRALLNERGMNR
jgi:MarR family transcriptional regulator, organic hydroperoxide resistance regulator